MSSFRNLDILFKETILPALTMNRLTCNNKLTIEEAIHFRKKNYFSIVNDSKLFN